MPIVRSDMIIQSTDIVTTWNAVSSFDKYPRHMDDVISVEFLERSPTSALTSWTVLLNGSELSWTERDTFEPYSRIAFESVDGDIEVFRGQWLMEETLDAVQVTLEVEFDLGIPSLAPVLDPIGSDAIKSNAVSMLSGIRAMVT